CAYLFLSPGWDTHARFRVEIARESSDPDEKGETQGRALPRGTRPATAFRHPAEAPGVEAVDRAADPRSVGLARCAVLRSLRVRAHPEPERHLDEAVRSGVRPQRPSDRHDPQRRGQDLDPAK